MLILKRKYKENPFEHHVQTDFWSERQDSNLRPDGPKPPALSTAPRPDVLNYTTNALFLQVVKSVVKPLKMGFLRERIVPKKSVFTRAFGVVCFGIPWGRCPAPKARALPTALHPEIKKGLISQSLGAPAENRTPDTLIKSQVLYQLSYRGEYLVLGAIL